MTPAEAAYLATTLLFGTATIALAAMRYAHYLDRKRPLRLPRLRPLGMLLQHWEH
jgi:hypothetical protein